MYEQLASEGRDDRPARHGGGGRGTGSQAPRRTRRAAPPLAGLSQRAICGRCRGDADRMGARARRAGAGAVPDGAVAAHAGARAAQHDGGAAELRRPAGEAALRAAIADHLRASRGVVCDAAQVFITDGTQSSLDLCMRALADEGDGLDRKPGYGGAMAAARAAGLAVTASMWTTTAWRRKRMTGCCARRA
jgi:GntR family transcriptional regulator/MocR family aminotransferase